ncbi:MAG: hypothetical protein WCF04_02245 [Candidatus Nanopelagicales bacterium]
MSRTRGILDLTPDQRSALTARILADMHESLAARDFPTVVFQLEALALVDHELAGFLMDFIKLIRTQS